VLGLVTGVWVIYIQHFANTEPGVIGGSDTIFVVGAFLALVSLVSFQGFRWGFVVGAVLSAVVIVLVGLLWGHYTQNDEWATLILAAATIVLDVVASRPSRALSEKDSPLNLPVFG